MKEKRNKFIHKRRKCKGRYRSLAKEIQFHIIGFPEDFVLKQEQN